MTVPCKYCGGRDGEHCVDCVRPRSNEKWKIEHGNDTGSNDEGIWEWWTVTNGDKSFKCDTAADAKWLCETLNG